MLKRLPNLAAWHWRGHHHPAREIAVPLLLLAALLMLSGVFTLDLSQLAVGVIALIAGIGLQRRAPL